VSVARRPRSGSGRALVVLIDLGSTAARFLLARIVPDTGYHVLYQQRVPTRLGDGPPGKLRRAAVVDTARAVHRFLRHLRRRDGLVPDGESPRIVAVATSAVRDAKNRERLLGALRRRDGVDVQVLSARQEARLGVEAALHGLPIRDGVVLDLGGSSLQVSRVRDGRIASIGSVPLGAVRLTRRFLAHDPPKPRELRALRAEIREQLAGALPPARRGEVAIGLGGTVRALASIHLAAAGGRRRKRARGARPERHGLRLQPSDITAIRERLEAVPRRKRRRIQGLKAERADIILAGVIAIEEAMTFGGYLTLVVCTRGVRDGLLLRETFDGRLG
jgi:exopolyphosphatase/guanosine-5'-triphosphate,3'-diphosphate pyrophosphatase